MSNQANHCILTRVFRRSAAHLRAHHEWYWAPILYSAVILYIYRAVFFRGHGPQLGLGWDTIEAYWADLSYLGEQFRHGHWPLWNPYERGGFPYFAVPERGTYYPVNWLFASWGATVGETSWWLVQLKGFAHHLIAAGTMHLFLRSRGLPRIAAIVGGVAWLASAPLLIHKASSMIWPIVWLPLCWIAVDALIARPTWRRGIGLGAALALAGNAGSAQGFFFVLLATIPYGLFRFIAAIATTPEQRRRWIVRTLVAVVIGAAVTAALLLAAYVPVGELTAMSQRAHRSVGYALQFPLPSVPALVGMVAPNLGRYDIYCGVAVLTLGLIAVTARPLRDRGVCLVFLALTVFFLALSFGQHTPLLRWLIEHVPGFDLFRASNRYKLLVAPLLAALAGYGAAAISDAARGMNRKTIAMVASCAAVMATAIALLIAFPLPPHRRATAAESLPFYLAIATTAIIGVAVLVPRRWAMVPLLALVPLVVWEPQHYVHFSNKALEKRVDNLQDRAWLEGLADVTKDWRIYDEFVLGQRAGSRLGVREFRSYAAGGSLEPMRYRRVMRYAKKHPEILAAFNIRYVFHRRHHRAGMGPNHFKKPLDRLAPGQFKRLRTARCERMKNPAHCPIFEAVNAVPAVVWYGAIKVAPQGGTTVLDILLRQLRGQDRPGGRIRVAAFDKVAAAKLPESLRRQLADASKNPPTPVTGEMVSLEANELHASIVAPRDGVLVVNDTMYPGWHVYVDGTRTTPFYANYLVRGVAVTEGKHDVIWRFEPAGQHRLQWLFALGVVVVLAAGFAPRRRQGSAKY